MIRAPAAPSTKVEAATTRGRRLNGRLLDRLTRDTPKGETWDALVMAALEGTAQLHAQHETEEPPTPETTIANAKAKPPRATAKTQQQEDQPKLDLAPETKPATAALKSVTVEGF